MNKEELKARAKDLGLDTKELDAASTSKNKVATNAELKSAIEKAEATLKSKDSENKAADLEVVTEAMETATTDDSIVAKAVENIQDEAAQKVRISLNQTAKDLGLDYSNLKTIEELQEAIDTALKQAKEKSMSNQETQATWKDNNKREWMFRPNAPKSINIDGRTMTQAEILESEDIISELAYGGSSFLTRKY